MGENDYGDNAFVNRHVPEEGTAPATAGHSAQPVPAPTSGSFPSSNAVALMSSHHGDMPSVAPAAAASGPGSGPGPVRTQKKRAQVSKACQRCRRLQKGCSESRPCQRCIGVGLEDQCLRSERMIGCHQSGSRQHGQHHQTQTHVLLPRTHAHAGGLAPATATAPDSTGTTATTTWSFTQLPASPESLVNYPLSGGAASASSPHQVQQHHHHQQQQHFNPLPKPVLDHCITRFFSRLYPTIPILTPTYINHLLHISSSPQLSQRLPLDDRGAEAQTLLLSLCALTLLQIEHPSECLFTSIGIPHSNSVYGRLLFEEAQASHHRHLLASGTGTGAGTERKQDEEEPEEEEEEKEEYGKRGGEMTRTRKMLADRLFWVLLVSERSHGIRYRRPITLQITPTTPSLPVDLAGCADDPELAGLASLVALFRPLDTGFMALLNQEVTMTSSSAFGSPAMVAGPLDVVERAIAEAVPGPSPGSGPGLSSGPVSLPSMSPDGHLMDSIMCVSSPPRPPPSPPPPPPPPNTTTPSLLPTTSSHFHTTQIANLKITQLWLRVILWQIRLRIGLLIPPPSAPPVASPATIKESLTYHHPLSIAHQLVQVTKSLPLESIRVHGVGLTEKVFDVACAMVDVLAKVPLEDRRRFAGPTATGSLLEVLTRERQEEEEREDLEWIRGLIHRLPGGSAIYNDLLGKHIAGVLPDWGLRVG
ncbi:hypothetical protein GE21DRAFT_5534 [Neurospora crassa]|uniref:RING-4 n=1 Tax=Neurospora crassa (strain ATCC 24698 / 74-OR23-1A / CBS 708.71 / DSM 1257 / FGSC 987) TaxID=367110 RepID=Q7S872_NEUCR|nr:RING-4 [Neurospora crassa OR74A]EAA32542.1 RING-4 [Neurospora crassa OR74A]KHE79093.1 hypothetical protein GE21DRAFT_5534 [Neurospora crassa]|eukprot:XP_961778.1 RING-4 [Neurospora crassa OR74A]